MELQLYEECGAESCSSHRCVALREYAWLAYSLSFQCGCLNPSANAAKAFQAPPLLTPPLKNLRCVQISKG